MFTFSMLLVRRSDRNWQLTKSSLHEVAMWNMWESISCSDENDCTTVHSTKCTVQLYTVLYSMQKGKGVLENLLNINKLEMYLFYTLLWKYLKDTWADHFLGSNFA